MMTSDYWSDLLYVPLYRRWT